MPQPNYRTNDPVGWCGDRSRGAAHGRPDIREAPADYDGQIFVSRVALSGGYDKLGTYFGVRQPGRHLFWVANLELSIDYVTEAADRQAAIHEVLAAWPQARIRGAKTEVAS